MTPNDIIARALRLIGVSGEGNPTPTPYQQSVSLTGLNGMLNALSRKRLIVPARWYFTFPLTSGQQTYSIGQTVAAGPHQAAVTPNFCTDTEASGQTVLRPIKIERAGVVLPNSPPGQPFELPISVWTNDQWASVQLKKLTGTQIFPLGVWPDNAQNPFIQNLWFWPVPNAPSSVSLYVWQPLGQISANTQTVSQIFLPDDYDDLLSFNLAVRIALDFQKDVPPGVAVIAQQCLDDMRTSNTRPLLMKCDPGMAKNLQTGQGSGRYNFYSDNL